MQQDHQVVRALVQDPVPGVGEPNPELAELAVDLRRDRVLRRRRVRGPAVEVLLDVIVDLGGVLGASASMNASTGSAPRSSR
jgi:hypothetical protein